MIEVAKREPRIERQPLCRCHAQGVTETAQRETLLTAERASFAMDDRFAYFNTAAISPLLHVVREAANRALDQRSRPWTIAMATPSSPRVAECGLTVVHAVNPQVLSG